MMSECSKEGLMRTGRDSYLYCYILSVSILRQQAEDNDNDLQ